MPKREAPPAPYATWSEYNADWAEDCYDRDWEV